MPLAPPTTQDCMDKKKNKNQDWGDGVFTLLSWFEKEKVQNARVLVAGAGALGNEVVKNLALFGVGHIFVVDFDRIERSNLTRSVLFREEDATNHAVVVTGINAEIVTIFDPENIVEVDIKLPLFINAWKESQYYLVLATD